MVRGRKPSRLSPALFITLFASDIEEHHESPHEHDYRPCPTPWAYFEYIELLEQADDADDEERKTAEPMTQGAAGIAERFVVMEKHKI